MADSTTASSNVKTSNITASQGQNAATSNSMRISLTQQGQLHSKWIFVVHMSAIEAAAKSALKRRLNGALHFPTDTRDIDPLANDAAEKIRDHRAAYNKASDHSISFMPAVASTSGRLHCELIRISRYFVPCRHILRLSASLLLPDISMCDLTRARSDSATLLSTPESGLKSKVGRLIAKASALEPRQSQC